VPSTTDFCAVSAASQLVADRWTILIVRELLEEPRRFNQLWNALPGLSKTLLSARLRRLQAIGVVRRGDAPRSGYSLTPRGQALEPVLSAMGAWAMTWPLAAPGDEVDVVDLVARLHQAALRTRGPERPLTVEFRFTEGMHQRVWAHLPIHGAGRVWVLGGVHPPADVVVRASPDVIEGLGRGSRSCAGSIDSGAVTLEGAPTDVRRFHHHFRPGMAGATAS
jgi:DNA-binding HxlR family transcriptional regulator